jgi:hypothetical protein
MALNKYEFEKIEKAIKQKLLEKNFTFEKLEISEKAGNILKMKFLNCDHNKYKNVRLMSHASYYEDSVLYTRAFLKIRFLYGGYQSPKIGFNLVSFKINLS